MTCIVGLVEKGNVYIGGDSAGVSGLSITVRADEKVFHNGPFIMGFTSSFRMGQLLRYKFSPPKQTIEQEDVKYMVTDFIDAAIKCFTENGYGNKSNGGTFLVGYNSRLYHIDSDFQVGLQCKPYSAVGCGSDLALGSMYATEGMDPEKRIILALEAAAQFSGGVVAPFHLVKQLQPAKPTEKKPRVAKKKAK